MSFTKSFADDYHKILCPDYPEWLNEYISLPVLQHLDGIGLLCGTDWTSLYSNRFFYSRLDHSIGTALITWHFTKDKKQTLASLFHDAATCAFSHVNDFRKGDALKQEESEAQTSELLTFDSELAFLLARDSINVCEIRNYHIYSLCDSPIPQLCADRLEYMFPSNMALGNMIEGHVWTLVEVKEMYNSISVVKNESGKDEFAFNDLKAAELYTEGFIDCAFLLQKNENKLALNMLGKIVNFALEEKIISEHDCFTFSEKRLTAVFDDYALKNDNYLSALIKKWRTMTSIEHLESEPGPEWYSVNIEVKKRWIDPLVKSSGGSFVRLSKVSARAYKKIESYLSFKDTPFGAVKIL